MTAGESSISTGRVKQALHAFGGRLGALDIGDGVGQFLHGKLNEEDDLQKRRQRAKGHLSMHHANSAETQGQSGAEAAHGEHHRPEHRRIEGVSHGVAVHRLGEMRELLGVSRFAHHRLAGSDADDSFVEGGRGLRVGFAKGTRGFQQPHLIIAADDHEDRGDGDDDQRQPPGQQ